MIEGPGDLRRLDLWEPQAVSLVVVDHMLDPVFQALNERHFDVKVVERRPASCPPAFQVVALRRKS